MTRRKFMTGLMFAGTCGWLCLPLWASGMSARKQRGYLDMTWWDPYVENITNVDTYLRRKFRQVRVCGWNVRWNDLCKPEQDAYIRRAENVMKGW